MALSHFASWLRLNNQAPIPAIKLNKNGMVGG